MSSTSGRPCVCVCVKDQFDRSYHEAFKGGTSGSVHLSRGVLLPTVAATEKIDVIMSPVALEGGKKEPLVMSSGLSQLFICLY